ncbi:MAG: hypothetical protein HXY21_10325 [Parvularculaceae bacterium]|nr:hypothetical protein [Parvularculaceae bacterium]
MSRAEQYSWTSLLGLAAIYWWFQMRMLDGWSVVDQSPSRLLWVYFAVIGASTLLEVLIAGVIGGAARGKAVVKDERDHAIAARAGQFERVFIIAAINIVIWQALWEGAMAGHDLPRIDLAHLPTLFFVLFTILFAGEFMKRITTIALYRVHSARG